MLFPDYFFFAEKRLVLHEIETKLVKDLYDCELFCYMNDNCVSANFKKDPEYGVIAHVCDDLWRLISDYSLERCLERDSTAVEVFV